MSRSKGYVSLNVALHGIDISPRLIRLYVEQRVRDLGGDIEGDVEVTIEEHSGDCSPGFCDQPEKEHVLHEPA